MTVVTTQVDGSLGMTIPGDLAREVGINPNSQVWVRKMGTTIVIGVPRTPSALDDLLGRVNETNLHGETDTGPAVGREAV